MLLESVGLFVDPLSTNGGFVAANGFDVFKIKNKSLFSFAAIRKICLKKGGVPK